MAGATYWKGLRPVSSLVGDSSVLGTETFQAAAGNALYVGQVVKLNADGLVVPVANSNAEEQVLGVIAGIFYINSTGRAIQNTLEIASTVTSAAGIVDDVEDIVFAAGSGVGLKVWIDPNLVYAVKATEAIVQADVGDLVQLVGNTAAGGAKITHTGTVPFGAATDDEAGGILKLLGPLYQNVTNVTAANTNISAATGLRNGFGSPETVCRVIFEKARTWAGS